MHEDLFFFFFFFFSPPLIKNKTEAQCTSVSFV